MKEKEIDQMNIEELRALVNEERSARVEAEKSFETSRKQAESFETFWHMAEAENKALKAKIEAVKAVASLF